MENLEEKLWNRVDRYLRFLKFVPFLRMVAVCNNLAFGRVKPDSDIDLFIVARKGRLFIVRSFVTIILQLMGVRRHGNKIAGRFCLSFFVDDSALCLKKLALEDDVYLAFWIKSMKPVLDDGVFKDFIRENTWIDSFVEKDGLQNYDHLLKSNTPFVRSLFEKTFSGFFGNFWNEILASWQIKRARRKSKNLESRNGITVSEHILKFHNRDRRDEYRKLWRKKFGNQKVTKDKFYDLSFPT